MTEERDEGLKVAYRGAPTEADIKLILKKRRTARIINTIVFIIMLAALGYFAYRRHISMYEDVPERSQVTTPAE